MSYTTKEAREQFSEVINKAAYGRERVVLTRRGKPICAVVPLDDVELLEELEDRIDVAAAKKALKEDGTITIEQLKSELGL